MLILIAFVIVNKRRRASVTAAVTTTNQSLANGKGYDFCLFVNLSQDELHSKLVLMVSNDLDWDLEK